MELILKNLMVLGIVIVVAMVWYITKAPPKWGHLFIEVLLFLAVIGGATVFKIIGEWLLK